MYLLQRIRLNADAASEHTADTKPIDLQRKADIGTSDAKTGSPNIQSIWFVFLAAQQRCILASPENNFGLQSSDAKETYLSVCSTQLNIPQFGIAAHLDRFDRDAGEVTAPEFARFLKGSRTLYRLALPDLRLAEHPQRQRVMLPGF